MAAAVGVPTHMRTVPGSVNVPVADWPETSKAAPPANVHDVAQDVVSALNNALRAKDVAGLSRLFLDNNSYWRDHLALSWRFFTARNPKGIEAYLSECADKSKDGLRLQKVEIDSSSDVRRPVLTSIDGFGKVEGIRTFINITTAVGSGKGVATLVHDGKRWKIYTLYTVLEELRGHEELVFGRRPRGVQHGGQPGRKNWAERRASSSNFEDGEEPVVLIIGAGQAGLTIAARLKMLGVPALIVDKNERVGDNWRKRYHQLVLHDPVWYDHLPYIPFPAHWPVFTPKDKLAEFFESYAKLLELNVWTSSELVKSQWDEGSHTWTAEIKRWDSDGKTTSRVLKPRHVIQATGHSGKKNHPDIEGAEQFAGHLICHSSEFPGAREDAKGKKAVVVGCCNSGHDIAQDFLEKGYDVTMVQRSSTHVVSSEAFTDIALPIYSETGPHVDDADLIIHGQPLSVLKAVQVTAAEKEAEADKGILAGLDKAGFKRNQGPDGAAMFFLYFQRGGGYYIDVGASRLIAEGKIKIKQGHGIARIQPGGLVFDDGSELEADEIVLATGYQNMRTETRAMFGDEVADSVQDVWGVNENGEMRTMWQPSGHRGFWFHGGNLALCRYYSRLLALQIKGLEEGIYQYGQV